MTNPYHLDESIFNLSDISSMFLIFISIFFAASHLGLICLPMSHKKDARLIGVNGHCHLSQIRGYHITDPFLYIRLHFNFYGV